MTAVVHLLLVFLTLLVAAPAFADAQYVTSSSPVAADLIAEVFESVGYRAQQAVLEFLSFDIQRLGLLMWIVAVVSAIALYIFSQESRAAFWLIIGPSLFFLAVSLTTQGQRVEWRYQSSSSGLSSESYRVSWIFHQANRLISKSFLSIITALTGDEHAKSVKDFMKRENLVATLLSHRPTDSGLMSLTRDVIIGCHRDLEDARTVGAGLRDPAFRQRGEWVAAKSRLDARELNPTRYALQNDAGVRYVEQLFARADFAQAGSWEAPCMSETRAVLGDIGMALGEPASARLREFITRPQTCQRLWCWMSAGFQSDVDELLKKQELDNETLERLKAEIAEKLTQKEYIADARDPTGQTPLNGKTPIAPDPSIVPVVVSGYLIRETMKELGLQGFAQAAFAESSGLQLPPWQRDRNYSQEMAQYATSQSMQYHISQAKQTEIFVFSRIVPYLQGLLLYALGLIYPFFALFLLTPGRAKFFVTFFMLWAWVKSWDIGFALVTQVEAILWEFFPHTGFYDPQLDPDHGPVSVLAAAFDGDPGFGLGTYYTIVGAMITAVPILSAQLFVGAYASVLGQFFKGLQNFAQGVTASVEANVRTKQAAMFDALRENEVIADVMSKYDISNEQNWGSPVIAETMNGAMAELNQWYDKLTGMLEAQGSGATITSEELGKLMVGNKNLQAATQFGAFKQGSRETLSVADVRLAIGRMRNSLKKSISEANAQYNYFNHYANSQTYRYYNDIRAGITGRKENFLFLSTPTMTEKDLQLAVVSQAANLMNELNALESQENRSVKR